MLGTQHLTTGEKIITLLTKQPGLAARDIHGILSQEKYLSIQAIHQTIKSLIESKVLLKHKKKLRVSLEWITSLQKLFPHQYEFVLGLGESLRYTFNDLSHFDAFWKHVIFQILEHHPKEPFFLHTPYEFWPYAPERRQSELNFYESFEKRKQHLYFSIGNTSPREKTTIKKIRNEFTHFHQEPLAQKYNNHHYLVIGNIIADSKLKKTDEQRIKELYESDLNQTQFEQELTKLLAVITHATFTLEHNPDKAKMLRKIIGKDFAITQNTVRKYNLW